MVTVSLLLSLLCPMLVIAENDGNLPQEFEFLETIKNENLTFGFDSKTGLGKLYDSRTDTVGEERILSVILQKLIICRIMRQD